MSFIDAIPPFKLTKTFSITTKQSLIETLKRAGSYAQDFKATFKEYPQIQKPATWYVTEIK